jgi:hypothetical protein
VIFREADLDFSNTDLSLLEAEVIGLNYKDSLDRTVDVFVVPEETINGGSGAIAGGDRTRPNFPGATNSVFIEAVAVPPANRCHVLGHELGHVLFDTDNTGHSLDTTNLFSIGELPFRLCDLGIGGPKRLNRDASLDQGFLAREASGPATVPPILQKK